VLFTCGAGAPVAMGKASGAGDVVKKKGNTLKKPPQGKAAKSSPKCASKAMHQKNAKPSKVSLMSQAASIPMNLAKGDSKGAASKGKGAEASVPMNLAKGNSKGAASNGKGAEASVPINLAKGDNKGAASKGKGAEAFGEEGPSEGKGDLGKGDRKHVRPSKTIWRVYQKTGIKMSPHLQRKLREDHRAKHVMPASEDWHT